MKKLELRQIIKEEIKNIIEDFGDFSDIAVSDDQFGNKIKPEYRSNRYLFTVANTPEGRERIKRAKEALSPFFKFNVRGRHSNRKEVLGSAWKAGTQNDIPVDKAQYLAVYVDVK